MRTREGIWTSRKRPPVAFRLVQRLGECEVCFLNVWAYPNATILLRGRIYTRLVSRCQPHSPERFSMSYICSTKPSISSEIMNVSHSTLTLLCKGFRSGLECTLGDKDFWSSKKCDWSKYCEMSPLVSVLFRTFLNPFKFLMKIYTSNWECLFVCLFLVNAKTMARIDAKRSEITTNNLESVLCRLKSPVLVFSGRYRDISGYSSVADRHFYLFPFHFWLLLRCLPRALSQNGVNHVPHRYWITSGHAYTSSCTCRHALQVQSLYACMPCT